MSATVSINSFSTPKPWVWLSVIAISFALHAVFLLSYEAPKIVEGAKAAGKQGIEIGLKNIAPPPAEAKSVKKTVTETVPVKKKDIQPKKQVVEKPKPIIKPKPKKKVVNKQKPLVVEQAVEVSKSPPVEETTTEVSTIQTENSVNNDSRSDVSAPNIVSTLGGGNPKIKASYRTTLLLWLERYKRYPSAAKRRRQEDVITLEFTIDTEGKLLSYKLIDASNYKKLNRAVEKMIAKASPLPPVPAEIVNGRSRFTYTVPIEFNLR